MTEITRGFIALYVRRRQEQGAAPATINRELGALRRVFRLAHKAGLPERIAQDRLSLF